MKKLVFVLIAVLLIAVALIPNVAAADTVSVNVNNSEIYAFVEELCELNKSADKDSVRDFLVDKFNEALTGVDGVEVAEVSHVDGTAKVTLSKPVTDETLMKAVEAADYKVTQIL